MKREKRRTEIYIETRRVTVIRTNGQSRAAHYYYCERCGTPVAAFTAEQVAAFLEINLTEVCRRIENAELHLTQINRDSGLICGNALQSTGSQPTTPAPKQI